MSEADPVGKKESKAEKKSLLSTINKAVTPLMKELSEDQQTLQMPELALRCAQFFHSISQYCVGYYNNYIREEQVKKTKLIKKQEKQKDQKGGRRGRKKQLTKEERQRDEEDKPEPPKKPLTAYIIYFQDKKPLFVERYPTLNLSQLTKLIAKQWKELSEAEKQVYLDRASEDRKRYDEQLSQFKKLYSKTYGSDLIDLEVKENVMEEEDIQAIIIEEVEEGKNSSAKSEKDQEGDEEEEEEDQKHVQDGNDEQQEDEEGDMEAEGGEEGGSGSGTQRNGVKGSVSDESSEQVDQEESVEEIQEDEK